MQKGTCKLCLKTKIELCDSHIFPEMFERYILRLPEKDSAQARELRYVQIYKKYLYKGHKGALPHDYALCKECENRLNVYENYFKRFFIDTYLYDKVPIPYLPGHEIQRATITPTTVSFDYHKFQMMIISLIWRASVIIPDKIHIVGEKHAERMRLMLLNDTPSDEDQYCFQAMYHRTPCDEPDSRLALPWKTKRNSGSTLNAVKFYLGRWTFILFMGGEGDKRGKQYRDIMCSGRDQFSYTVIYMTNEEYMAMADRTIDIDKLISTKYINMFTKHVVI